MHKMSQNKTQLAIDINVSGYASLMIHTQGRIPDFP